MVACCVYGCSNRTIRDDARFFRFPGFNKYRGNKEKSDLADLRKRMWLCRIGRADLTEARLVISRICSDHFVSGEPADIENIHDVDWAPSLYLGHNYFKKDGKNCVNRLNRKRCRQTKSESDFNQMTKSKQLSNTRKRCRQNDVTKPLSLTSNKPGPLSSKRRRQIKPESSDKQNSDNMDSGKELQPYSSNVTIIYVKTEEKS